MLEKMYWHLLASTYVSLLIGSVFSFCISCREHVNKDETGRLTHCFFFLSHTNFILEASSKCLMMTNISTCSPISNSNRSISKFMFLAIFTLWEYTDKGTHTPTHQHPPTHTNMHPQPCNHSHT